MIIYLIISNEEIVSLEVKKSDLILFIKLKIQEKFGYPFQWQSLKFRKEELKYDLSLFNFQIINEDILELELAPDKTFQNMIIIRSLTGKFYFINVKLSDSIEEIMEKYEEMSNLHEEEQYFFYYHNILNIV